MSKGRVKAGDLFIPNIKFPMIAVLAIGNPYHNEDANETQIKALIVSVDPALGGGLKAGQVIDVGYNKDNAVLS
jgi:hypothetical protein